MANKEQLRAQRENTVINGKSKREDRQCQAVVKSVLAEIEREFNVEIRWKKKIQLMDIVASLRRNFPGVKFARPANDASFVTPDGGVSFLVDKDGNEYPILIAEVKNQGTNDSRAAEGKKKQALGNAVERLGKNVIGFRTYMLNESIFPFVCFGDGCDFADGSSILDRIHTIAMFGEINTDHTMNEGPNGVFNRGSYYFREAYWTAGEMKNVLMDVARRSVFYYFSKYGDDRFVR